MYENFWDVVSKFLDDKTAIDERRHDEVTAGGDVINYMAIAISLCDMYRQCVDLAKEKGVTKIPSQEWFRLQF